MVITTKLCYIMRFHNALKYRLQVYPLFYLLPCNKLRTLGYNEKQEQVFENN